MFIYLRVLLFPYPHTPDSYAGQKLSENIFCQEVKPCFETTVFEQNFYHFVAEYLARIWTYENAEKYIFFQAEVKT